MQCFFCSEFFLFFSFSLLQFSYHSFDRNCCFCGVEFPDFCNQFFVNFLVFDLVMDDSVF